jgi:hypothetical protein
LWVLGAPFAALGLWLASIAIRGQFMDDPGESLYVAPLAALLCALGGALILKSYRENRITIARNKASRAYPNEPWRWRADWNAGTIVHSDRRLVVLSWLGAGLGAGLTFPIAILSVVFMPPDDPTRYAGLPFAAVASYFMARAARVTSSYRQFRSTELSLDAVPGQIGGLISGAITSRARARPSGALRVTLQCLRVHVHAAGKHRRIERDVLYEDTRTVLTAPARDGFSARFELPIPNDVYESNDENPIDEIQWHLRVGGETDANQPFAADFTVPVFRVR